MIASSNICPALFHFINQDICCVEGVIPKNQNIGVLSFDHVEEANKCMESTPDLREPHHYGGQELFVVPLCSPAQSWPGKRTRHEIHSMAAYMAAAAVLSSKVSDSAHPCRCLFIHLKTHKRSSIKLILSIKQIKIKSNLPS